MTDPFPILLKWMFLALWSASLGLWLTLEVRFRVREKIIRGRKVERCYRQALTK